MKKHLLLSLGLLASLGCCAQTLIHYDTLVVADSMVVIQTVCAPICSSVARVYNKQGAPVRTLPAPNDRWVFPEAYIQSDSILWRDNTPQLLDEEEKNHPSEIHHP